jgi:sugar O-acyltransferase (sialic acid O-acetyltransferase NeuD family)
MKQYIIFGHGHLLGDIADIIHLHNGHIKKIVTNMEEQLQPRRLSLKQRTDRFQYKVEIEQIGAYQHDHSDEVVIGFTGAKIAKLLEQLDLLKSLMRFPVLIHPSAIISPTAEIGLGSIINAGVIIASNARIGKHVLVNRGATIGHDTFINDFAVIQPGCNISGYNNIGCGAFIGVGAKTIECLIIGEMSVVAAGAVVIRDVASFTAVAGVPAKLMESSK